jgi:hypothetical protein
VQSAWRACKCAQACAVSDDNCIRVW